MMLPTGTSELYAHIVDSLDGDPPTYLTAWQDALTFALAHPLEAVALLEEMDAAVGDWTDGDRLDDQGHRDRLFGRLVAVLAPPVGSQRMRRTLAAESGAQLLSAYRHAVARWTKEHAALYPAHLPEASAATLRAAILGAIDLEDELCRRLGADGEQWHDAMGVSDDTLRRLELGEVPGRG